MMRARPCFMWLFLALAWPAEGFAQKLMIETPSAGPVARVFYGQVTLEGLTLFETKYRFELSNTPGTNNPTNDDASASESSSAARDSKGEHPVVMASFFIPENELKKCTQTTRFRGLMTLAATFRGKVNSATLNAGPSGENCAESIRDALGKLFVGAEITLNRTDTDGIKIELGIANTTLAKKTEKTPEPKSETPLTLDQLIRGSRLTVGEKLVRITGDGWFVAEVPEMSETTLDLVTPGRKPISIKVFPSAITADPKPIPAGFGYKAVVAIFSKPELKIYISEIPFLAQKTTLDGGAGGGLGYGREVPGERRGERIVSMLGVERREIYRDFGGRMALMYTNAGKTVVPHTFTARGLVFYDHRFFDDSINMRIAAGMELFQSKITQPKNRPANSKADAVLVPSQVSTPTIGFSVHKIFKNGIIIAPSVYTSPLYVSTIGFYPSVSPSLEFGYKLRKDLVVALNAGSETHRFPSVAGETKLQMDYAFLSIKRGLY